jgi:hypothetical protein
VQDGSLDGERRTVDIIDGAIRLCFLSLLPRPATPFVRAPATVRSCVRSSFRALGSSSPPQGPSLQSSTAVAVLVFGCRGSFQAVVVVVVVVCFIKKIFLLDRSKGRGRERVREGRSSERPVAGSSEDGFSIGRE